MTRMQVLSLVVLIGSLLGGCAVGPKPKALRQLEAMLDSSKVRHAGRLVPVNRRDVDISLQRAREAWLDNDDEEATHWARLGMLAVDWLLVTAAQREAEAESHQLRQQLARARETKVQLAAKIEAAEEKIMLYEELAMAEVGTKEKELELSDFQQRLDAQKKLSMAQLALKLAETVDAPRHATATYRVAAKLVSEAQAALSAESLLRAARVAMQAKKRAEQAYQKARPRFVKVRRAADLQKRSQALRDDAAAISGVKPKLVKVGKTQQLVLPVLGLFGARSAIPLERRLPVLNALAKLLKQHPSFPVIVSGYTSSKVPRDRRYALSWSRAKQVVDYLLTFGLPFSRFAVCGRGDENQIAPPKSSRNDRVELVLFFQ